MTQKVGVLKEYTVLKEEIIGFKFYLKGVERINRGYLWNSL